MTAIEPFREVFADVLRGQAFHVAGLHEEPVLLPAERWRAPADAHDEAMLELCDGPTLDVGCGPGRMSAALAARGQVVLGIDIVEEAVTQTRRRGAPAVDCDVFTSVPAEGWWRTALLADGNVGIGGDPVTLLRRLKRVIEPAGRVVVGLEQPGTRTRAMWAELVSPGRRSKSFRWAVVGVDDIADMAAAAGLAVASVHSFGDRWCAVLNQGRVGESW
ncbi:MAG TPA: methyltransferase domain-containing protein [Aeromicrobium sp.]|nr:methyltransferase domain-containing protein [Aeromicrobium sp.]